MLPLSPFEPNRGAAPPVFVPEQRGPRLGRLLREAGRRLELRHARAVLTAVLEARSGRRSPGQLRGVLTPRLYQRLRIRPPEPGPRYTVRSVRASEIRPGVIEVCGTAHAHGRASAITATFVHRSEGWRCTDFVLVEPPRFG